MQTAKLFQNGQSQAVRLPKEHRFTGDVVGIVRMGDLVVLYPAEKKENLLFSSLGNFTDDFFESIEAARKADYPDTPRETLDDTSRLPNSISAYTTAHTGKRTGET